MSLTLEGFGGVAHHDLLGLGRDMPGPAPGDALRGRAGDLGTSAILRLGGFEVGALWAGSLNFTSAQTTVLGPLVGFAIDPIPLLRIELLGEVGGHEIRNIELSSAKMTSTWLPYAGIRPGVSLRFPAGATRSTRFVVGVWGFARWDLAHKQMAVEGAGPAGAPAALPYDVGGSSVGVAMRFGIEF